MMKIGYACLTAGVPDTELKSCILKNASEDNLTRIIDHNLNALENIIDYNIKNEIKLFRISSDIIPFGSNHVNKLVWWEIFGSRFKSLGSKIIANGLRVSMHPGQYTVINSNNEDVVSRAIDDLIYHDRVLNSLGVDCGNKIILHIGGIYNDKEDAIGRFSRNYDKLASSIKNRLVIENDEKSYNIQDVLKIGKDLKIPVVYDNLHNAVNPYDHTKTDCYWIEQCRETWTEKDGMQKVHYSQQNPGKKPGAHSDSIRINHFIEFYEALEREDLDIMLEVKDKNISALKCINCTRQDVKRTRIETEWGRYKYKILENSQEIYLEIRALFRDDQFIPVIDFYNLIEAALDKKADPGNFLNSAMHVWGYFKNLADEKEKKSFLQHVENRDVSDRSMKAVKRFLHKMAIKYKQDYLLDSYYFVY